MQDKGLRMNDSTGCADGPVCRRLRRWDGRGARGRVGGVAGCGRRGSGMGRKRMTLKLGHSLHDG